MSFTATLRPCRPQTRPSMLRLTLFPGETFSIPRPFRHVTVWAGQAWVSYAGQDQQLTAGETLDFDARRDRPVISSLGDAALIFEIRGEQSCR